MSSRREITGREVLLLALGAVALAVVMEWPLILNLGETIPKDLGDPLVQAWQAAWGGHALVNQPLDFFQSNQFWPLENTLALSDALVGYAPLSWFGSGSEAAIVRYDLLFLFAYALAFAGAYLLARELGLGPLGAAVAGAAFAFAPFRLEQDGHMHVISSGGIPLAFAVGLRGYRLARPGWVIAGWAVATWQLTIGWTLGLPLAYLLLVVLAIWLIMWWRRGRPAVNRRLVVATLVGGAIFTATAGVLSGPYLEVADDHPESKRTAETVENFSGPPTVYLVAPDENLVWGEATSSLRDDLENVPEKTLFPGLAILVLAAVGFGSSMFPRWLSRGLLAGTLVFAVLAYGFHEDGGLLFPYRIVYELFPGWEAIRVPGRLVTFASLGLALLAAAGTESIARSLTARGRARAAVAVPVLLAVLVVIEGRGLPFDPFDNRAQPVAPDTPIDFATVEAPQFHLPAERAEDNRRYLVWSTDGFPAIVNGRSSTNPTYTASLIERSRGFPDTDSVAVLQEEGIRSVVIHTRRVEDTPWEDVAERPIAGLPLTRERIGDVVVYEIEPASSTGSGTPPPVED